MILVDIRPTQLVDRSRFLVLRWCLKRFEDMIDLLAYVALSIYVINVKNSEGFFADLTVAFPFLRSTLEQVPSCGPVSRIEVGS